MLLANFLLGFLEKEKLVVNAPVNYAIQVSGPVTASAWRPNKSM